MTAAKPVDGTDRSNPYDVLPYASGSFPQSHPNRMAVIGMLFGLNAVAPSKSRVLELGCAEGANLLPMADQAPNSTFLGIDGSKVQIATGLRALGASGLKNIELRQQDILDFSAAEGKFDYIIVHGIFSWVPEPVRQKILQICSVNLAENGIAMVSYNALPGWNMRKSLRDMVQFHIAGLKDIKAKLQQMRALVKFLAESVPTENNAYGVFLKQELETMSKQADGYLAHEILEGDNTAFYFTEFVARAASHGLQYLGEPSLPHMLPSNISPAVGETLRREGLNAITQEQYMDFVRNRTFRQTLLCHATRKITRVVNATPMANIALAADLRPPEKPVDLTPGVSVGFPTLAGRTITAPDPLVKAALHVMAEMAPSILSFRQILEIACRRSRPFIPNPAAGQDETDEHKLRVNLMSLTAQGFVTPFAEPILLSRTPPAKPRLSPLVRHQAIHSRVVTNLLHMSVPCDVVAKVVMAACDGRRSHDDLVEVVIAQVKAGTLTLKAGDKPVTSEKTVRECATHHVDRVLRQLARVAFFPA